METFTLKDLEKQVKRAAKVVEQTERQKEASSMNPDFWRDEFSRFAHATGRVFHEWLDFMRNEIGLNLVHVIPPNPEQAKDNP